MTDVQRYAGQNGSCVRHKGFEDKGFLLCGDGRTVLFLGEALVAPKLEPQL